MCFYKRVWDLVLLGLSGIDVLLFFFFLMIGRPPRSPLFPSPPLSRSQRCRTPAPTPRGGGCPRRALGRAGCRYRGSSPARWFRRPRASGRSPRPARWRAPRRRSEEHTSELQSQPNLVCRLLLEKKIEAALLQLGRAPILIGGGKNDPYVPRKKITGIRVAARSRLAGRGQRCVLTAQTRNRKLS